MSEQAGKRSDALLGDRMTLDEIHQTLIRALRTLGDYCKEHDLRMFLLAGTALGAVRHKGIIPWDDDIDVGLPREDYDRLCSEYPDNGPYRLLTPERDADYYYGFAKLCDTSTVFMEPRVKHPEGFGVFIDVFPLDHVQRDARCVKRSKFYKKLYQSGYLVDFDAPEVRADPLLKRFTRKALAALAKRYEPADLRQRARSALTAGATTEFVGNIWSAYGLKAIFPSEWFGAGEPVQFEDSSYLIPAHWDEYLTQLYGDYMTPPASPKYAHGNAYRLAVTEAGGSL